MSSDNHDDDGDVGYGRPPKRGQFKKGQSGNPEGRAPRGGGKQTNPLDMLVPVRLGKRRVLMPISSAILASTCKRALGGDAQAERELMRYQMHRERQRGPDKDGPSQFVLSIADPKQSRYLRLLGKIEVLWRDENGYYHLKDWARELIERHIGQPVPKDLR